ncbi:nitroreductase family protein [Candidatus Pacearchaeota archaeon]|nr:nitroreductase family protein [Candidatus Pacearchaeota archaeon]
MELNKAIKERHSVRRFTSKKPKYDDILEAIGAANSAPLAGNIPTLRFVLVSDAEKINKIAEACQQDFISQANYLVVVCSDSAQAVRSYGDRGKMYARQQAGASIENFLLKITDLGLASCWTGAFVDSMIKQVLVIPDNVDVEAVLPIGYEMPKAGKQRKKTDLSAILFFNKWKEKYMKPWKKPEAI